MRLYIIILLGICLSSCNRSGQQQAATNAAKKAAAAASKMPDSLKAKVLHEIRLSVKSGFYSTEETFSNVKQLFPKDSLDNEWLRKQINRNYVQAFNSQTIWSTVTKFDKFAAAFDQLNANHIIALHNLGTNGREDCGRLRDSLRKKGIITRGYCFYRRKDVDTVIDDRKLLLTFGAFAGGDKKAVEIGKAIVKALKAQGFKTSWNNAPGIGITITDFSWHKRFGNGNCSYYRAVKILSGQKVHR